MEAAQTNVLHFVVYGLILCILVFMALVIGLIVLQRLRDTENPQTASFAGVETAQPNARTVVKNSRM